MYWAAMALLFRCSGNRLKQVDFVRETGLERGAISRYVAGKYEPKQTAVAKLAVALNVP